LKKQGIVLFAHGSREPQWAQPLERLAQAVSQRSQAAVLPAYLEHMTPTLDDAIAALVRQGAERIRVVPIFLGMGGHLKKDLPALVSAAREKHAPTSIELEPPIGDEQSVIDAIAAAISRS
jgi:sirohydrochlorin cobaltochelatase